jgi:hypothetical protein
VPQNALGVSRVLPAIRRGVLHFFGTTGGKWWLKEAVEKGCAFFKKA